METLLKDLRYAVRMLIKTPGVTAVAVITLGLGIGANTAIFSGVNAFLMRPLPVPEPDRVIRPIEIAEDRGTSDEISYPDFVDYREQSSSFAGLAAEDMVQAALNTENQNDVIWGQAVSGSYFDVLQVKPAMGRPFLKEEDEAHGAHPVVVLSDSLWRRRFDADPNIVGKAIQMNARQYQVIGVAPASFRGSKFGLAMDFWVPIAMVEELRSAPGLLDSRNSHWMNVIGRLKPNVTTSQASAELNAIARRLNQSYPDARSKETQAKVVSELEGRWQEANVVINTAGAIAMAIAGLILLIACANVANLLLARGAARRKEIGIRLALGASRPRLVRQLLTESLVLALLGGGLGLLLAYWITQLMQGMIPVLAYNIVNDFFALDSRALLFTVIASLATGIIFGLAPALQSSNPQIVPVLKGVSEAHLQGKLKRVTLRNSLVVAQVALSLMVLVCGGLFIKSFRKAQAIDPGFGTTRNALLLSMNPQLVGYGDDQTKNFYQQVVERTKTLPGVEAVGLTRLVPLGDSSNSTGPVLKEGETLARGSAGRDVMTTVVDPGYFDAMQIPFVEGRNFDDRDQPKTQRVVIINQRMAEILWPGEKAVGRRILIGADSKEPLEVVGVVKTGKYRSLAEDPKPYFYGAMSQRRPGAMTLVVRTSGDPVTAIGAIRSAVQSVDRQVPMFAVKTMQVHLAWPLWGPNLAATFSLAFGLLALLLSAVGLYSVMAYVVSQRTREVGIRMALGANRRDVLRLVTGQGMRLAVFGVGIGLVLATALAKVISSLLIGISSYDIATFAAVSGLLTFVALIACYLPARRATKVDPLVALRYE
ncbi:MAG TPA: ABC transporter permease [Pyrinomonadaceae bacterium]|nr:ABC transporter permease [Pyrinomonadaceae bacterium]